MNLESTLNEIRETSLIRDVDEENPDRNQDFEDWLLQLSSRWRRNDRRHRIRYSRPDQPLFELESSPPPEDNSDTVSDSITFSELGRQLTIRVEGISPSALSGLMGELSIIGSSYRPSEEQFREPETNLLYPRPFEAEAYAEYQRFVRHETPMYFLSIRLQEENSWRKAAQTLKHSTRRRDVLGLLNEHHVAAVFPSTRQNDDRTNTLTEQLRSSRFSVEPTLQFLHVPTDTRDWADLKDILITT